MLLSASLIVKDEAEHLGNCLKSLTGVADEVVVCDTGSSDATMNIARKYGATVFASERFNANTPLVEFDFAEARNEALAKCSGDWVLSIDADETLHAPENGDGANALRHFLARADSNQYGARLYSHDRMRIAIVPRMFRRKGTQWRGTAHERPDPWAPDSPSLDDDICSIEHHGEPTKAKLWRNLVLLRKRLLAGGRVDETTLLLADTYRQLGPPYFGEALGYYIVFIEAFGSQLGGFRPWIMFATAECWGRLGNHIKGRQMAADLASEFPDYQRAWLLLAELHERDGHYEKALDYYRQLLRITDPMPVHPFIDEALGLKGARARIEICAEKVKHGRQAS